MAAKSAVANEELSALQSIYDSTELCIDGPKIKFTTEIISSNTPLVVKNADQLLCTVKYLPPVTLTCILRDDYPSSKPLQFCLECSWLTTVQLQRIAKNLNFLHSQNFNFPVLYIWMSFIQNETAESLNLGDCIDVSALTDLENELYFENFCVRNNFTGFEILKQSIITYDDKRKTESFNKSVVECEICFIQFGGHDCVYLECAHVFCKTCFSDYLKSMIDGGRLIDITCAHCDLVLTQNEIFSNLDEKHRKDYDRWTFNYALSNMPDIDYCPMKDCNSPVLVEKDEHLGICPKCRYSFCPLCKKSYHGEQNLCSLKDLQHVVEEYRVSNKERQILLERKYGKPLIHLIDETLALEEINKISKKCPNCKASIEKHDGCNRIFCTNCKKNFCWCCLKVLSDETPYDHFNTGPCLPG